jgi:cobalt-zinc-cadmium efflux system membrane fusion protein
MKATEEIRNPNKIATKEHKEHKKMEFFVLFVLFCGQSWFGFRFSDLFRISLFGFRILLLLSVVGLGSFLGCARRQSDETANASSAPQIDGDSITFSNNAPQLEHLKIESVREQKPMAAGLTGRLAWNEDATARVFSSVSGRIVEILANPGQAVSSGDILAKIRSPGFGQAQAEARKAVVDLKVSERALARVRELREHGAAAAKDFEAAEADYARALSEKERALATLALYGGDAWSSEIDGLFLLKAPLAGVVVEKAVNPGQEVRSDQVGDKPLFVISDPVRLWVFLDATEQDLSWLKTGTDIKLRSQTYPDQTFPARIEVISDYIDPNSRTIKVRGSVSNARRLLKAEMFVSAELSAPLQGGVNVPASAIFFRGDKHYLFVQKAKGSYQLQEVGVGQEQGGQVLVHSGLQVGQNVVTDGGLLLSQLLAEHR